MCDFCDTDKPDPPLPPKHDWILYRPALPEPPPLPPKPATDPAQEAYQTPLSEIISGIILIAGLIWLIAAKLT